VAILEPLKHRRGKAHHLAFKGDQALLSEDGAQTLHEPGLTVVPGDCNKNSD